MTYKFQRLEIYQLALDYIDLIYAVCEKLPRTEDFGLRSQITRAANSIALNIAEGSTSQSDPEQTRFLGIALRSLIETIACMDIIERRKYLTQQELEPARELAGKLFAKIQAMRKSLCSASVGTNSALQRSSVAVVGRKMSAAVLGRRSSVVKCLQRSSVAGRRS